MAAPDYYIQDNADMEAKKLDAAKGLYSSGDYQGALRLYLDMLNSGHSYKLYYEIGRCYYKLGDMQNAELYFTRSSALEETKNPSFQFLGNILYKAGNVNKAVEYWSRAFVYKPDDESVCLNLATSYFSKNMKLYSAYYYRKYLKYAKDKKSSYYAEIKKSLDEFENLGRNFYKKAQAAAAAGDRETALQALEYGILNFPSNFDINYLLGKLYYESKDYNNALKYFKLAFCIDTKSRDALTKMASLMSITGDFTGAYCCMKRMLPLVLSNQKEYLEIVKTLGELESRFNGFDSEYVLKNADKYYEKNDYRMALFEYENCAILDGKLAADLSDKIQFLKLLMNPEARIVKSCFEKGSYLFSAGDYKESNKYFSKILNLTDEHSSDYKLAKSKIMNV